GCQRAARFRFAAPLPGRQASQLSKFSLLPPCCKGRRVQPLTAQHRGDSARTARVSFAQDPQFVLRRVVSADRFRGHLRIRHPAATTRDACRRCRVGGPTASFRLASLASTLRRDHQPDCSWLTYLRLPHSLSPAHPSYFNLWGSRCLNIVGTKGFTTIDVWS